MASIGAHHATRADVNGLAPVSGKSQARVAHRDCNRGVVVASSSSPTSVVFVTGNKGKVARLELALGLYCRSGYEGSSSDLENERDGCSVLVDQVDLDIPEIQADTVREVALRKALDAFAVLKRPLVVHDCGLTIAALGDWPGPYTKNANDKLGTEGLLKLLAGVEDRRAGWDDTIVYVDENGEAVCFGPGENRENEKSETGWTRYSGEISISPPQKYERFRGPERALGRCFIPTRFGLTECLADVSESEYQRYRREAPSVWNDFAKWWGEKKNENA